jgi:hypothetical protein
VQIEDVIKAALELLQVQVKQYVDFFELVLVINNKYNIKEIY